MPWHWRVSKQCARSRVHLPRKLRLGGTGPGGGGGKRGEGQGAGREPKSIERSETSPYDLGAHPEVHIEEGAGGGGSFGGVVTGRGLRCGE